MNNEFYITDVFTNTKYSGNQLATVILKDEIPKESMQKISREFNFSETTFVLNPNSTSNTFKTRIFTPTNEIPFAGHPTLGTAFLMHKFYNNTSNTITVDLPVGKIPVEITKDILWMTQKNAEYLEKMTRENAANLINIDINDIRSDLPIQSVSTGLPALIIPVKNLNAVKNSSVTREHYNKYLNAKSEHTIYVFSEETYQNSNQINARVFFDADGIREDPATGSATGCLGGYLYKYLKKDINISIEQGFEIDRNSILKLKVKDNIIKVGGEVSLIAKGSLL